jgi:hypothetical protein
MVERAKTDGVNWEEIYALELSLIDLLSEDEVRFKLSVLIEEFRQSASEHEMEHIDPAAAKTMKLAQMQGLARALLDELHQRRISLLKFENARTAIVAFLIGFLVLGVVVVICIPVLPKVPTTVAMATVCGFAGSAFSYLQRLRSLQWTPGFGMRGTNVGTVVQNLLSNLVLSFIIGIIAANVLLALFAAGIVSGELLPKFNSPSEAFGVLRNGAVLVKIGLWAFVAGFSERLVPDRLNHLAGIAADDRNVRHA